MQQILLDRNENQYGPAPACQEVLRRTTLTQLSLYSRSYLHGSKGELAARLAGLLGIPEERIVLSYGSEDMLKQSVHCHLNPGECMLVPEQSWWYYRTLAGEVSGRTVTYPLRQSQETFAFDPDEIIALSRRHHPSVLLIASPNNPTGNGIAHRDLVRVADGCPSAVIIIDEAYHGPAAEGADRFRDLLSSRRRLVVLRTFSKYYALAGLRIGYAGVSADLRELLAYSARYLGFNRLSEQLALAALDSDAYYRQIQETMDRDRDEYFHFFSGLEGFRPYRSEANFFLLRFPTRLDHALKEGLRRRGIAVKFLQEPGLEDFIRISIGTQEQNAAVMKAFRELADLQASERTAANGS